MTKWMVGVEYENGDSELLGSVFAKSKKNALAEIKKQLREAGLVRECRELSTGIPIIQKHK